MKKKNSRVYVFKKSDGVEIRVTGKGKQACCMRQFGFRVAKAIQIGLIQGHPIRVDIPSLTDALSGIGNTR